jgi:hypothetical protein
MPDLSLPETSLAPPPGVRARDLDERATLAAVMAGMPPEHDDVVDPVLLRETLAAHPLTELTATDPDAERDGTHTVRFPVVATDASVLGAMYSIPLEQAWALLPATERLVPVRVTPTRAAASFFAWSVRRGGLGPYRQIGVAIPVALDMAKPPSPAPPGNWRNPAIGLYAVELPVDSQRVAQVGAALSGLPHVVGTADVEVDLRGGSAGFALDGEPMARLDVRLSRWARHRRFDLTFQAYSLLGGRIVRQRHVSIGDGYRGRRGEAELHFGEHRRAQRLARLELSRRPLEVRALPRVNWISLPPEDLGAI